MCFVKTPNLPKSDAVLVAVSGTYQKIINSLQSLGIEVIPVKPCFSLSDSVNSHADMILHHVGDNRAIVANGEEYLKFKLQSHGFEVTFSNKCISKIYPNDVPLNAARVGNRLIANQASLDETIITDCIENGIKIIPVNQGYAKCSTVVVDENSIITADQSIAKAATAAQMDTLLIEPGYISLKGCNYGFIGGTCGFINQKTIVFSGNIEAHPNYNIIKSFFRERNIQMIALTNGDLIDIGGIIPLKEME